MPVLARCPMCRAVLPAGSADAPGEVRCPRCAEMVLPAARKLCARCSRDVTRERRMKDAAGEYYCPDCWSTLAQHAGKAGLVTCGSCGGSFPETDFAPEGSSWICLTCRAARDRTPESLLSASDLGGEHTTVQPETETFSQHQARQRRRRQARAALWVTGAMVVAAVIVAIVLLAR